MLTIMCARKTSLAVLVALVVGLQCCRAVEKPDKWAPLRTLLKGWEFTQQYAISVGDATGQKFLYESGKFTMKTPVPTGSTSKWPSAIMFAGLVNDGTISGLDEPVNKYISWWTKDPADMRSEVTLRMLLSFTSGFGDGHPGQEGNTRIAREWRDSHNVTKQASLTETLASIGGPSAADPCNSTTGDTVDCARSIYTHVKLEGKPGTVYSYNSNHLNLAAAVAVKATGLHVKDVVKKYLLEPYNMTDSFYYGNCPDFAADLITTGDDYEKFLHGVLSYNPLNKEIVDASEEDNTPFMSSSYSLYGDYGFGHFLMCYDSTAGFTKKCAEARCHMDPGAFGFMPIIDRKNGYYMQLVAAEIAPTGSYALSGIPEYLAVAIKPHIDAIMSSHPPNAESHLHYTPKFMSLGVADVNYCLQCKLHPKTCLD